MTVEAVEDMVGSAVVVRVACGRSRDGCDDDGTAQRRL
jgi:hypothetical protein